MKIHSCCNEGRFVCRPELAAYVLIQTLGPFVSREMREPGEQDIWARSAGRGNISKLRTPASKPRVPGASRPGQTVNTGLFVFLAWKDVRVMTWVDT